MGDGVRDDGGPGQTADALVFERVRLPAIGVWERADEEMGVGRKAVGRSG